MEFFGEDMCYNLQDEVDDSDACTNTYSEACNAKRDSTYRGLYREGC